MRTATEIETGRSRANGPETSREAGKRGGPTVSTRLLDEFQKAGSNGLTDEEAAEKAGLLDTCYWKRCNELRQHGLILGTPVTRVGRKGVKRMVSVYK